MANEPRPGADLVEDRLEGVLSLAEKDVHAPAAVARLEDEGRPVRVGPPCVGGEPSSGEECARSRDRPRCAACRARARALDLCSSRRTPRRTSSSRSSRPSSIPSRVGRTSTRARAVSPGRRMIFASRGESRATRNPCDRHAIPRSMFVCCGDPTIATRALRGLVAADPRRSLDCGGSAHGSIVAPCESNRIRKAADQGCGQVRTFARTAPPPGARPQSAGRSGRPREIRSCGSGSPRMPLAALLRQLSAMAHQLTRADPSPAQRSQKLADVVPGGLGVDGPGRCGRSESFAPSPAWRWTRRPSPRPATTTSSSGSRRRASAGPTSTSSSGTTGRSTDPAAADARSRVRRHGRRGRAQRASRRTGATTSPPRATSPAGCASTAARARRTCASRPDPGRGPRRGVRRVRRRPGVGDLAERPHRSSRRRSPRSRSRSATRSSPRACTTWREDGGDPRLRADRPVQHRDRPRLRRRARPRVGPRRVPAGACANDGRHRRRQRGR